MISLKIFTETMGQNINDNWYHHRKNRITTSIFGSVIRCRSRHTAQGIATRIKVPRDTEARIPRACQYGIYFEPEAREAYCAHMRYEVEVRTSGFCVPSAYSWIGGSPDGIVYSSGEPKPWLLEIKTIYDTAKVPRTIRQIAKERGSSFYCTITGGDQQLKLRRKHPYFYQIMGMMGILGLDFCDFVIYAPRLKEIVVVRVQFEEQVWDFMLKRLGDFYSEHLGGEPLSEMGEKALDLSSGIAAFFEKFRYKKEHKSGSGITENDEGDHGTEVCVY